MDRSSDWMEQANILLHQAKWLRKGKFYPGSCFNSQQAAEMALKALLQSKHIDAWGHMLTKLLTLMPSEVVVPDEVHAAAAVLDRMYTPTRYPNGFEEGVPRDYFRASDADDALARAKTVITFSRGAMDEKR
jgi:HEPN domain-containing protein